MGSAGPTAGDVLFVQPPHLTATSPSPASTYAGQPEQPDIIDLETQAEASIAQGTTPPWHIEDSSSSMRSSIRVGNVSFDLSWLQGAGPPTLPPMIPIAPNVLFSARGTVAGSWRGVHRTPQPDDTVRHPPRARNEPTLVAYKTMSTPWRAGPTLSPGVTLTLWPVGEWIGVTRFDLSFASEILVSSCGLRPQRPQCWRTPVAGRRSIPARMARHEARVGSQTSL